MARRSAFELLRTPRPRLPSTALHVIGIALAAVSCGMLLCALLELASTNMDTLALVVSGVLLCIVGIAVSRCTQPSEIRSPGQIFGVVGWTWVTITLAGALPYVIAGTFSSTGAGLVEQVVNSIFESASGFSCSGSTVLSDFDTPGRGLMMYRQATHWYGGMGVVVLAVAVLPFLGVGGLELVSAETPGVSSDRLRPRVSETARRLWVIYACFTAAAVVVLFAVPGPSLYDAVAHALSVAATGGFSPYADSIGHFDSVAVEIVLIGLMIFGGTSFSLHWRAVTRRSLPHFRNSEFRYFLALLGFATWFMVAVLWFDNGFGLAESLRAGLFNAVSLGTSTGFSNATGAGSIGDYVTWAAGAQMMLLFLMIVGGCTGSTSGGMKVMRMQILGVVMLRSVRQSQTPRAVIPVRLGRQVISESIVARVAGFFLMHFLLVVSGLLVLTALGGDFETSLGSVVSALGNMGPALDQAGPTSNYAHAFGQPARLVLAMLMIIGRLEIMPILLAIVPYIYRASAITRSLSP